MSRIVISLIFMFMLACNGINISINPSNYNYKEDMISIQRWSFHSDENIIMPLFTPSKELSRQNETGIYIWVSPTLFLCMVIGIAFIFHKFKL